MNTKIPNSLLAFFLITLIVYSGVLIYFLHLETKYGDLDRNPNFTTPIYDGDAADYATLATNLLKQQAFTLKGDPEVFRTPGYPLFLALVKFFSRSWLTVSFVQMILAALTGYLIYQIGLKMQLGKIAYLPGWFYVLDPTTIFNSVLIASDILFTFLIVLAIYVIFFADSFGLNKKVIFGGLILGSVTLVRPIGSLLPLLIIPLLIYKHKNILTNRQIFMAGLLLVLFFGLLVLPWMIRNQVTAGFFGLSTITAYNLFNYNVPYFLSWKLNLPVGEVFKKLDKQIGSQKDDPAAMWSVATSYIKQYPFSYAIFHLTKTTQFFFASSFKYFLMSGVKAMTIDLGFIIKPPNLSDLILKRDFSSLVKQLRGQFLFTVERLIWVLVVAIAVLGLFSSRRYSILLCLVLVLYFAILTGPVSYVRYRLPAEPFMFLAAAGGAKALIPLVKKYVRFI